jgi:hypothetical protein
MKVSFINIMFIIMDIMNNLMIIFMDCNKNSLIRDMNLYLKLDFEFQLVKDFMEITLASFVKFYYLL